MRNSPFWWIILALMVILDIYVFQVVKYISHNATPKTKTVIYTIYWVVSVSAILFLVILPYLNFNQQPKILRNTIFAIIAGLFFAKLIASVFFLIDDIRRGIQWVTARLFFSKSKGGTMEESVGITRSVFLSWIGMIAGGGIFGSLIYGFGNKYRYQLKRHKLAFENLPASFKGLKIVHISDIHSGSFTDKQAVLHGVEKILNEKADVILFTGDLVNDVADEMKNFMDVFNRLEAPMGVYSTLGNHDYGDYIHWDTPEEKKANLERLKGIHGELGWRLLMNEMVELERGDEKIALIGIENWGAKARFPKYGDLKKAYEGADAYPFKILMSHDPSHWEAQVQPQYADVDLTLSGHTHGMQFGVEI
ncbi:MAG: metallophosphoesterase, partial [Bacteroidota bacterium]